MIVENVFVVKRDKMTIDDWEEVKRLAGDLQRAQAASTAERYVLSSYG